jgi:hypothetical protein
MCGKEGRDAIAVLCLPACDGRRCLAHAGVGKILLPVITIPSVSTSVNQRNTDLSVRLGLARVSASALQCVPCPISSLTTNRSVCGQRILGRPLVFTRTLEGHDVSVQVVKTEITPQLASADGLRGAETAPFPYGELLHTRQ